MTAQNLTLYLYLLVTLLSGIGITDSAKADFTADAAEKLVQALHNPAQCPRLAQGFYNASGTKDSEFIEVYDNKDMKRLELNLSGYEQIPVNGVDTIQKNGFRLTAACIADVIRIVGKDASGKLSDTTVELANDGGLQVEQHSPRVVAIHYSPAGELKTPMDAIKKWFTPESTQTEGTGLPQQGNQQSK
jgi:hypothetical protein